MNQPLSLTIGDDTSVSALWLQPPRAVATYVFAHGAGAGMRHSFMEALSQAAAEITTEMRDGSVDVRLAGRDLEFVVERPTPVAPATATPPAGGGEEDEDGATARITLRLPEGVKTRAEELAAKTGSSLNTWIVNILRAATRDGAINIDIDLSSIPFGDDADPFGPGRGGRRGTRRMTGWV